MSRIAVIGASSFSGRAFVAAARANGDEVHEFSRCFGFDLNGDLAYALALVEPSHVVNFAALNMVAESWQRAQDYYRTNVLGVTRLADALAGARWLRKFVQVSTPEVYGATEQMLDEEAPMRPSTPYAVSRAATDMHLAALHKAYGLPVCFTRTVNVYGPGQQPYRIIPKTALSILRGKKIPLYGGGMSRRSFIHIRDVAHGTLKVATDGRPGEVYHMAVPELHSIADVVRMVCERMGAAFNGAVELAPERPGKDPAYLLNDDKIRRELDWTASMPLTDGLDETVAWFKKHTAEFPDLEYRHAA